MDTATRDKEARTVTAVDLLTNFVGSFRWIVHKRAFMFNDVFAEETV